MQCNKNPSWIYVPKDCSHLMACEVLLLKNLAISGIMAALLTRGMALTIKARFGAGSSARLLAHIYGYIRTRVWRVLFLSLFSINYPNMESEISVRYSMAMCHSRRAD